LGGTKVVGLQVTFADIMEGSIGTLVYLFSTRRRLEIAYRDPADVCAPAELRDVDADGRPELLAYLADPSGGDCGSPCHVDLWNRFHLPPAWVQVRRWTGKTFAPSEVGYASFYRNLAVRYDSVSRWLASGPGNERCSSAPWVSQARDAFKKWAAKARTMASEGKQPQPPT
jgi:hypothetical protein